MPTSFREVATEYADLNIFNTDTRETIIRIADLFDRRSECTTETFDLAAVGRFKQKTLKKAQTVTYNGYIRYLRIVGDYAVSQGVIDFNYFRSVKTAPVAERAKKVISDNDFWALVNHVSDNPELYRPLSFWLRVIQTLYFTGVRRRQLVSLRIGDLDFTEGNETIYLRSEGSKTLREWAIPMHASLVEPLKQQIKDNETALNRPVQAEDPLFNLCWFSPVSKPCPQQPSLMQARAVTDFFKRVNKRTGLKIGAHRFRHSLATRLCNPQVGEPDIFSTQTLLGHTSLKTTRGYVTASQTRLRNMLEKVEMPVLAEKVLRRT